LFRSGGGPGNVAEQHGHDTAFALDTTAGPGSLQLLKQLSGDVLFQLGAGGCGLGSLAQLMAAIQTESRFAWQFGAAFWARSDKSASARHAEFGTLGISGLALSAVHASLLKRGQTIICHRIAEIER
jgi:hypothetical protein